MILEEEKLKELIVIHYGNSIYSPDKVRPIINDWVKPKGGFRTSPINSNRGWKDWCKSESYGSFNEEESLKLKFNKETKIYIIDDIWDLRRLPFLGNIESYKQNYLDFEKISKEYDAIFLTENGQEDTKYSEPGLYGWDCESVLILNPHCCYQITSS